MKVIKQDRPEGHFYSADEGKTWYKSVTNVTHQYPKGPKFYEWVAKKGYNAELIKKAAGEVGNNVHQAIEQIVQGDDDIESLRKKFRIGPDEHIALVGFRRWYADRRPIIIHQELPVVSHRLKLGGTVDFVAEIDEAIVVGDFKTSRHVAPSHWHQLHAYAFMLHEMGICTSKRLMVLHLNGVHERCYMEIPKPFSQDTMDQFECLRFITANIDKNDRNRNIPAKYKDEEAPDLNRLLIY